MRKNKYFIVWIAAFLICFLLISCNTKPSEQEADVPVSSSVLPETSAKPDDITEEESLASTSSIQEIQPADIHLPDFEIPSAPEWNNPAFEAVEQMIEETDPMLQQYLDFTGQKKDAEEKGQWLYLEKLNGSILVPDGYYAFGEGIPYTDQMCSDVGMDPREMEQTLINYLQPILIVPSNQTFGEGTQYWIKIKDQNFGELNFSDFSENDYNDVASTYSSGFGAKEYKIIEQDGLRYFTFTANLEVDSYYRCVTIINGRYVSIIAYTGDRAATDEEKNRADSIALSLVFSESAAQPDDSPSAAMPAEETGIYYSSYHWGTSYDAVFSDYVHDGMVLNRDYYTYDPDSGLEGFAKELVVTDTLHNHKYAVHFDFDENDRLVSVMPVFAETVSSLAKAKIFEEYLSIVESFQEQYGAPEKVINPYDPDVNQSIDTFIMLHSAKGFFSGSIWTDSDGNQLVVSCKQDGSSLLIIIIFNDKNYTI